MEPPAATGQAQALHGASVVLSGIEKRFDNVGAVRGISLDILSGDSLPCSARADREDHDTDDDRRVRNA
jgi:hypothetical protein